MRGKDTSTIQALRSIYVIRCDWPALLRARKVLPQARSGLAAIFSDKPGRFYIILLTDFFGVAAITRIAFLRQSVAIQAASVMPAYRAWKTGEHLLKTIAIKTRAGGRSRGWYLARGNLLARYALLVSFATKSH